MLRFLVTSLSIFFARSVTYSYTLLLLLIDSLRISSKMLAICLCNFSDFFVSLRRPFNHIFVYALSSSPRLPRTHLKLFCKRSFALLFGVFYTQKCLQSFLFLLLKVEPSKLNSSFFLPRKEVIQPHLPIRLPCYDFTPVICFALGSSLLAVESLTLGPPNSHGVTGGVYKTRERIHRDILIRDY